MYNECEASICPYTDENTETSADDNVGSDVGIDAGNDGYDVEEMGNVAGSVLQADVRPSDNTEKKKTENVAVYLV